MERHDTHALSYSSSEEHSYQFDKNLSSKNFQSENKYFTKEEEKNDWTNIFINSFKEMKNSIGLGDLCNFNDMSKSEEINEKIKDIKDVEKSNKNSKDILKDKIKEKSKNKSKDKSKDKGKDKSNDKTKDKSKDKSEDKNKDKSKDKNKDKNKDKMKDKIKNIGKDKNFKIITLKNSEKIQDKYKSKTKNNSPTIKNKKEIKEGKEKTKEKSEKKERQKDKFTVLENGIVVKKINQQKEDDENEISNDQKIKKMKDNIIKEYFSHYNNTKNPMIIKKPQRGFITKINRHKSRRKDRLKNKHFLKKGTNNNIQTASLGNYNKLSLKTGQSTYSNNDMKRQNTKSRTILINRNQNNLNKLDDKFSSLSTITAKKLAINNNSNLFFSGNISNKNNIVKKRPLSSYNIIKKEIDINLKSSKLESSFYNKSFSIQKTGQISSIINANINHKNKNKRKKIIYENKNFLNDLKDLKNAFELSDNNIIISNNKNSDLNINTFSERTNKTNKMNKIITKHNSENNNIDAFSIKTRKLNSAKVRGKSYEYFYPRDPTPLFIEFNNRQKDNNEIKIQNENNICNKCGYKRHFGCEKDCPICINIKEKNKIKEKKLSNLNYYYPFKDKNSTTNSIHNSFRNNNSNNSHKIKQIINHDSFINFINIKLENMLPMDYYFNPFYSNSIHTTLNKKKRVRMNSAKQIRGDKSNIYNKYNALHKYFE